MSRDIKQGTKITWSEGFWNRIESVLLSLWDYVRSQYQKIFENNPHIFKCSVAFTKEDLWLKPLKASIKLKDWKKHKRVIAEKKAFKWEVNIKDT